MATAAQVTEAELKLRATDDAELTRRMAELKLRATDDFIARGRVVYAVASR